MLRPLSLVLPRVTRTLSVRSRQLFDHEIQPEEVQRIRGHPNVLLLDVREEYSFFFFSFLLLLFLFGWFSFFENEYFRRELTLARISGDDVHWIPMSEIMESMEDSRDNADDTWLRDLLPAELDEDKNIIVFCHHGQRSRYVQSVLL